MRAWAGDYVSRTNIVDSIMKTESHAKRLGVRFHIPHAHYSILPEMLQSSGIRSTDDFVYTSSFFNGHRNYSLWFLRKDKVVNDEGLLQAGSAPPRLLQAGSVFLQLDSVADDFSGSIDDEACAEAEAFCSLIGFALGKKLSWNSVWIEDPLLCFARGRVLTATSAWFDQTPGYRCRYYKGKPSFPQQHLAALIPDFRSVDFVVTTFEEFLNDRAVWTPVLSDFTEGWASGDMNARSHAEVCQIQTLMEVFFDLILKQAGLNRLRDCRTDEQRRNLRHELAQKVALARKERLSGDPDERIIEECFCESLEIWLRDPGLESALKAVSHFGGKAFEDDVTAFIAAFQQCDADAGADNSSWIKEKGYVLFENTITRVCLMCILSMLGYGEDVRLITGWYRPAKVLPKWDRLKLSAVEAIAQKLLA